MKKLNYMWLILLCVPVYGQEDARSATEMGAFGCKSNISASDLGFEVSRHFAEVQREAVNISTLFCKALNDPVAAALPTRELAEFGVFVESQATQKFRGTSEEQGVAEALRLFATTIDSGDTFPLKMPDFDVGAPAVEQDDVVVFYSVSIAAENDHEVSPANNKTCVASHDVMCSDLLFDLSHAINPYKRSYQISNAEKVEGQLTELHNDWNSFFSEARSMTTLDLIVTSVLERKHMRQGFLVGPVKRQWFVLHPNVVLQYTDAAPEGDRFEPGLSVEWLGVNYWSDGPFGIPIGASITTVYSDRADIDQVGHGITLHFDNRYSVGWTKHGSDDAFHVSVDLLEFFKEKQTEFNRYKDRVINLK